MGELDFAGKLNTARNYYVVVVVVVVDLETSERDAGLSRKEFVQ